MKTPINPDCLKSPAVVAAAKALLVAEAFAKCERERVDAYIRPVFEMFKFPVRPEWREGYGEWVREPKDLYLCEDEAMCADFYRECDFEHRAHGFTGPDGHCPALIAEDLARQARNLLVNVSGEPFGIDVPKLLNAGMKTYDRWIELVLGAVIAAGKIKTARDVLKAA